MKKVYLASAMMGAAMILAAPAQAVDSTGCGLGSMAWRGQRGIGPQVLAATTNGSFGTQIFGTPSPILTPRTSTYLLMSVFSFF